MRSQIAASTAKGFTTLYIVAIAYVYVIFMIAVTDKSIVGGIITFVLLGLFPLWIFLWIFGTPSRRRARIKAEQDEAERDEAEKAAAVKSAAEAENSKH